LKKHKTLLYHVSYSKTKEEGNVDISLLAVHYVVIVTQLVHFARQIV